MPAARRRLTRGTKSVSDETMTNVSTGELYINSTASMASRMSLEFLPDAEWNRWMGSMPSSRSWSRWRLWSRPEPDWDQSAYALLTMTRPWSDTWSKSHWIAANPTFS